MLQPGNGKVNIVRSFSTPVFVDKAESFRKLGSERKGYVLLRSATPRIHTVQPSRENESVDAINHHISTLLDAEKGEDIHVCKFHALRMAFHLVTL